MCHDIKMHIYTQLIFIYAYIYIYLSTTYIYIYTTMYHIIVLCAMHGRVVTNDAFCMAPIGPCKAHLLRQDATAHLGTNLRVQRLGVGMIGHCSSH